MKMDIFSVRDNAVGAFLPPFFARTKGEAIRAFSDACNSDSHQFRKHASDYALYHLGTFDDFGATFEPLMAPNRVMLALDAIIPDNPFMSENLEREADKTIEHLRKVPM